MCRYIVHTKDTHIRATYTPTHIFNKQAVKKLPPRVIPYHKHQEGKKRLAEVLFQQSQRTSFSSMDHGDVYRMLTSPDTPHTLQPPSDDHMEKASLDSRGSTEASASVSSGDVATGTLIDIIGTLCECTITCTCTNTV